MEIFKFIPGFRSGTKWKMLVASIYYFYTLYTLNFGIGTFLLTISCPFFIFALFDVTRRRGGRRAILTLVISFMLFDLGYSLPQNARQYADNSKTSTSEPAKDEFTASVDNSSPKQNSQIKLTVAGAGGTYTAVCHFKSKDSTFNGTVGTPLNIDTGSDSSGYKVVVDISVAYNSKTYTAQTSFTPQ